MQHTAHTNTARLLTDNGRTIVEIHLCEGKEAKVEKNVLFEDGLTRNLTDPSFQYDAVVLMMENEVNMLTLDGVDSFRNHPDATLTVTADAERPLGVVLKASRFKAAAIVPALKYLKFSGFATDRISLKTIPQGSGKDSIGWTGLKMDGLFGAGNLTAPAVIVCEDDVQDTPAMEKSRREWYATNAANRFQIRHKL